MIARLALLFLLLAAGTATAQVVLPLLLQGPSQTLTPCAQNLVFDGTDTTGCTFFAVSAFH